MDTSTFIHRDLSVAGMIQALAALDLEFGAVRQSTRTLLDTFDGRLHAAEMTLQAVQAADLQAGGLHLQLEQHGSLPATVITSAIPRFAADLPAGPLGSRVRAVLGVRALLPLVVFDMRTRTAVQREAGGRTVATVTVCDEIELPATLVPPTVTIAAALGQTKHADRIAEHLLTNGFEMVERHVLDIITAAAGIDRRGVTNSATVPLHRQMPASDGFRAVLLNLLDTMQDNWQGTIHDLDTEFLHDLRVAVRRTRSIIGQAKRVLPESLRARYRDDFAWLAGATGPTRDLDAYALEWPRYVAELPVADTTALQPVLDHIVRHRGAAHAALVSVLQSERAIALLAGWRIALAMEPVEQPSQAEESLGRAIAKRFRQAHHTVVHQGRLINAESPAEHLHDLRKDTKKLRYLVECFATAMPGKLRRRFVMQLKGLQDNLGQHQDAEVHAVELAAVAAELAHEQAPGDTLVALSALTQRLEQSQRDARAEFAERFAGYDSPDTEELVAALVEALER